MGKGQICMAERIWSILLCPFPNRIRLQLHFKQEEHHRKRTFREEYLDFLEKFEVPYEERFFVRLAGGIIFHPFGVNIFFYTKIYNHAIPSGLIGKQNEQRQHRQPAYDK